MNTAPTINQLAYDAYVAFSKTHEPVTASYDDFIKDEALQDTWLNVANVFTTHFAQSEPVTQSVAA